MDQVSEIESKIDSASIGSIFSTDSMSPVCDTVSTTVAASSTLSLTTSTVTSPKTALTSCESLSGEGKSESVGHMGKIFTFSSSGRVKAESTSVLMDCAESRRSEMGRAWKKSGSASRDDLIPAESSILSRRKGNGVGTREHQSQPGNLSDISEMKGMPNLHTAACSDLLAVIDTSCENVFLNRAGQTKARLMSNSSYSSSSVEVLTSEHFVISDRAILEPCAALEEDVIYEYDDDILTDTLCSLSDVHISDRQRPNGAEDMQRLSVGLQIEEKATIVSTDGWRNGKKSNVDIKYSFQEKTGRDREMDTQYSPSSSYRPALCVSGSSGNCDSPIRVSPLPDVELPITPVEVDAVGPMRSVDYRTSPVRSVLSSENSSASNRSISGPALFPAAHPGAGHT